MIINLLKNKNDFTIHVAEVVEPNIFNAIHIKGDSIVVQGDYLKDLTISTDGGYTFEQLQTGARYTNDVYLKSELPRMSGYQLQVEGNGYVSGRYSNFQFSNLVGFAKVEDLLLDVYDLTDLFNGAQIQTTPKLMNQPYNFTRTFYDCVDMDFVDLSSIDGDTIQECYFEQWCPMTTDVMFNESVDKEIRANILKQRHEV